MSWPYAAAVSLVIMAAYFSIFWLVSSGLRRTGQLGSNRLGTATALIFFSCGVGHGLHALHLLEPLVGLGGTHASAVRDAVDWHVVAWDLFTAGVAVWYVSLRRSFSRLLESPEMFDNESRRALEQRLEHQAFHDDLTGLANRPLVLDRLANALARGRRNGSACGVLFLDLDRFKTVNDSLGHVFGDRLLTEVAGRLDACVRPEDTVARLGGDEFLVVIEDIEGRAEAARVAGRIADVLAPSFTIAGQEVFVTTSIGCAISKPGDQADELLRDADIALYCAKDSGPGSFEVFESYMSRRAAERLELETSLRHALERRQLELVYQPQVRLGSGEILAAEALLRWHHPERGLVSPNDFIPLAEESGLILPIGRWVLAEACRTAASWAGGQTVCVNLSARQFAQPELADEVLAALEIAGLEPARLCLEITESVVMREVDRALATMRRLEELGVKLALDDFGKGHSSLTSLKRFPLDVLKIDRSFVSEIAGDADTEAIVRALVGLAHTLEMDVVAEGIESELQLRRLADLDCDLGQGFHLARPLAGERLEAMLADDQALGAIG